MPYLFLNKGKNEFNLPPPPLYMQKQYKIAIPTIIVLNSSNDPFPEVLQQVYNSLRVPFNVILKLAGIV